MKLQPSFEEFVKLSKKGNLIPVSFEFPADLETPVSVFLKLGRGKRNAFLLESVELGERLGRYSFLGFDPDAVLKLDRGQYYLEKNGRVHQLRTRHTLLELIQEIMKSYRLVKDPGLPGFVGGFIGYIGYELVQQFEDVRLKIKPGLPVPDSVLFFARNLIVFDHLKHHAKVIHLAHVNGSPARVYRRAQAALAGIEKKLRRPIREGQGLPAQTMLAKQASKLKSNMTRAHFEEIVRRAKKHIRAGDIVQAVLSQRFDAGKIRDDFELYRNLRCLNPSPYMFYLKYNRMSLVGSSPELLSKKTGNVIEVKPIAGTRPRGENQKEDLTYESALKASIKEMAEHLMLVDLGRNDLGRVAEEQSVQVENFAHVERFSHVMHLVSDIKAKLKKGKTCFDVLSSTFPAGTVSGAPKIRAIQIIDDLEPTKRGPYAGSLGYFSLNGDMDMCITIRTIVVCNGRAYIQAGAGIVNDSVPAKEYEETVNKAKALLQTVEKSRVGI